MKVYIGVGSNVADKAERMQLALKFLSGILLEFRCCAPYATHPLCGTGPDYLNAVACGNTDASVDDFVTVLKTYERKCGRTHSSHGKRVEIDLDLVMADDKILRPDDMEREYFRTGYRTLTSGNDQALPSRIHR